MEKLLSYLPILSLCVGAWAVLNGVLHDVFVLLKGNKYDRDLLRLLMDGHILITCGMIQMIAWHGMKHEQHWGIYCALIATVSLLVYCGMIWPFLKSIATIVLNLSLLIGIIISLINK